MKAYTDLEQSKKLAEILPIGSADMSWVGNGLGKPFARTIPIKGDPEELCGCWSLAALLGVLPYPYIEENYRGKWTCKVEQENTTYLWEAPNPIDACYEMILKLHGLKILGYEENNQAI